jgi:hypothetical protein
MEIPSRGSYIQPFFVTAIQVTNVLAEVVLDVQNAYIRSLPLILPGITDNDAISVLSPLVILINALRRFTDSGLWLLWLSYNIPLYTRDKEDKESSQPALGLTNPRDIFKIWSSFRPDIASEAIGIIPAGMVVLLLNFVTEHFIEHVDPFIAKQKLKTVKSSLEDLSGQCKSYFIMAINRLDRAMETQTFEFRHDSGNLDDKTIGIMLYDLVFTSCGNGHVDGITLFNESLVFDKPFTYTLPFATVAQQPAEDIDL